jgi:hypothetical protein
MKIAHKERSAKTMAKTNKKYASARMKKNNPMYRPEIREKVKTSLRVMGWKPPVRGGNGHGPTAPQMLLASVLGWEMEVAIPTGVGHKGVYPTCYKVDIGNKTLMVAIEIDGNSHLSLDRQEKDKKKDLFLSGLGWTVLRFTNQKVMEDSADCVQTVLSTISKSKTTTPT